jgi:hypothetical protein
MARDDGSTMDDRQIGDGPSGIARPDPAADGFSRRVSLPGFAERGERKHPRRWARPAMRRSHDIRHPWLDATQFGGGFAGPNHSRSRWVELFAKPITTRQIIGRPWLASLAFCWPGDKLHDARRVIRWGAVSNHGGSLWRTAIRSRREVMGFAKSSTHPTGYERSRSRVVGRIGAQRNPPLCPPGWRVTASPKTPSRGL